MYQSGKLHEKYIGLTSACEGYIAPSDTPSPLPLPFMVLLILSDSPFVRAHHPHPFIPRPRSPSLHPRSLQPLQTLTAKVLRENLIPDHSHRRRAPTPSPHTPAAAPSHKHRQPTMSTKTPPTLASGPSLSLALTLPPSSLPFLSSMRRRKIQIRRKSVSKCLSETRLPNPSCQYQGHFLCSLMPR